MSEAMVNAIRQRLNAALAPMDLVVRDDGDKNKDHVNEGKGHFYVRIVSAAFTGLSPLQRHRLVYATLAELMDTGIHALSIDARAA